MTLSVIEYAAATHAGHVRRSNEDSHLAVPPLFVVADGMGGARAGETASRICVETFAAATPAGDPEASLRTTIGVANTQIHERSLDDVATSGMGTTVTAALVTDGSIAVGHVGDSRAYLLRDGVLQQLSDDHSLVGELVRRGAITPEEAERHPQRSVITRVLGTETHVDVDTFTLEAHENDVVLLCSDGLSGMVGDLAIQRIVAGAPTLAEAARDLVRAANAAGGDDNITAVLFRVGSGPAAPVVPVEELDERPTMVFVDPPPPPRRRSIQRRLLVATSALAVAAALVLAGALGLRYAHFVGATQDGRVAIYQGVPLDIGAGIRLYRRIATTTIPVAVLTTAERRALFDHAIVSLDDARTRIDRLPANAYWGTRAAPS